ncbi:fumarylacetoacetate hydrolase family protein [Paracoccus sp. J55]|uniref:fumarylacetoacetate hydrolase family protein n=1 Tax=Paracoccus sp. J55 TaxID=935849 RepID=UPI001E497E47|nr:fumarylacetoacetate hydrolase family protein [Paracoccus sp. J55]
MDGDGVIDITDLAAVDPSQWPPVGMVQFIARFGDLLPEVEARRLQGVTLPLSQLRLEAPVRWPNKIIAFPANYHEHISEMRENVISQANAKGQGFFLKANSSISGPADPVVLPPVEGREIHHECELGIVIGQRARGLSRNKARGVIFGFTCLLDMVIRGREERVMRKSYDTFCPIGPWIVTPDDVPDMNDLTMRLWVNGEQRQSASTRDLIVDIPEMIAMSSAVCTLEPGDIIATGTPAGVGPVRPGDTLSIEISHIGRMDLRVEAGAVGAHPVWNALKIATLS